MLTSRVHSISLLPQGPTNVLVLFATLVNGAIYRMAGVGSQRPDPAQYDPHDWRSVNQAERAMLAGQMPMVVIQAPLWEAIAPIPGTDAFLEDSTRVRT